jgi:hypothetical protein
MVRSARSRRVSCLTSKRNWAASRVLGRGRKLGAGERAERGWRFGLAVRRELSCQLGAAQYLEDILSTSTSSEGRSQIFTGTYAYIW